MGTALAETKAKRTDRIETMYSCRTGGTEKDPTGNPGRNTENGAKRTGNSQKRAAGNGTKG